MSNGYGLEETAGNDITIYGIGMTPNPRSELSEFIDPPALMDAVQVEADITTLFRHSYLPQAPLLYKESESGYHWNDTYPSTGDQILSPERLVTIFEEPPSALVPSLPSTQDLHKLSSRREKPQVGNRRAPTPARYGVKKESFSNNQRRERIVDDRNGIELNDKITNQNDAKHKRLQQRNLIAAKRCRKRKQENLMRLQSDEQAIERRHRMLSSCVESLKEEVLYLKAQILQHASCECTPIHLYMEKQARRYIDGLSLK
ncbi:hypothetical protein DER46DRAFT_513611 [Fusarium sp. MPI-SDFR-AT-0072]|nr:hypothetical protein DER46DRAFT_513611 [Fusarium sp. MPI-SDFR-AT-0072]